jgi:nucleotide-binding universal stress UspA family protein
MRFASASDMATAIRNILLPTDFGPSSERSADYAASLARALGAAVHLVHVIEAPAPRPRPWHQRPSAETLEGRYHEDRARLEALAAAKLRPASDRITVEVRIGSPAKAIVDAAIDYGADLIVMSAPARQGVPNLRMGSVAERVLETAPCPVLQVRQSGGAEVHFGARVA